MCSDGVAARSSGRGSPAVPLSAVAPRPRPTFCQGTFQRGDSTVILTGRHPKPKSAESPLQFHADLDGASAAVAK